MRIRPDLRLPADPGGQTIGAAEGIHVGADHDQQHGGADEIDTGQGLQQRQGVALLLQGIQQPVIEAGDGRLELLDMAHRFVQHEAVTGGQLPVQGIEEFRATGLESATGKAQHLTGRLTGDDGLDHGARRGHHRGDPPARRRPNKGSVPFFNQQGQARLIRP